MASTAAHRPRAGARRAATAAIAGTSRRRRQARAAEGQAHSRRRISRRCSSTPCSSRCSPASTAKARSAAATAPRRVALVPDRRIRQVVRQGRRHRHRRPGLSHSDRPPGDAFVSATSSQSPIASVGEAEQAIENLNTITDQLVTTIEEETKHVRAGRLQRRRRARRSESRAVAPLHRRKPAPDRQPCADRRQPARRLRRAARAPRRLPGAAADQYDGAGDRPCGIRGHHPRRFGRACPQARARRPMVPPAAPPCPALGQINRWRSADRFNPIYKKLLTSQRRPFLRACD